MSMSTVLLASNLPLSYANWKYSFNCVSNSHLINRMVRYSNIAVHLRNTWCQ